MIEASNTYYQLYLKLFEAHKLAPNIWTLQECTRILTSIMAAKSFSWRVVGITPLALDQFSKNEFKKFEKSGITRAHIVPRFETVLKLISNVEPKSETQFFETWINNDKTVLCAKGENKARIPNYIAIENPDGKLFSCEKVLAGWKHGKNERELLRVLNEKYIIGSINLV